MANCLKHPQAVAKGTCAVCAESFCGQCLVPVKGQMYCSECKTQAIGGKVVAGGATRGEPPEAGEALKYAIIGIFCCGIILGPIAISKAMAAKRAIEANPGMEGSGKATAALVIGIIVTVLNVLGLIANVAMRAQGRGF
jgi:hypothetical protein